LNAYYISNESCCITGWLTYFGSILGGYVIYIEKPRKLYKHDAENESYGSKII